MIDNSCKLLELHVFTFLSDDNGARSASFSSSEVFLVFLNFTQSGPSCFNNELAALK